MDVKSIFLQKINKIQSRVPIKFSSNNTQLYFNEILEEKNLALENSKTNKPEKTKSTYSPSSDFTNNPNLFKYIDEIIKDTSSKYGMDSNLIKSIIKAESNFDYKAKSNAGAMGLMQLMPGTAELLGVNNPYNIKENIDGGVRYFKERLEQFDGNVDIALAAYNAGPNNVKKYNGIPPFSETKNYIETVNKYYNLYKSTID